MFKKLSIPNLLFFILILISSQIKAQEEQTLIGSINNQLIKINTENATTAEVALMDDDFGDLILKDIAFSKEDCVFYGIVGDGNRPPFSLAKINLDGKVERIGELTLSGETFPLVEALAYNEDDGALYMSASVDAGVDDNDFYSETIVKVSPTDASCEYITEVDYNHGSPSDIDQMVFAGSDLYLHDGLSNRSSSFYKLDFSSVSSSTFPPLFLRTSYYGAGDIAHNDGKLYFPTVEDELYELDLETKMVSYIGQTHDETQYDGGRILGVDFVPSSKLQPKEGTAHVQLIHNIHDQRASLTVNGRLVVSRAKYRSASKFIKVEAGTYDLELNPVGEGYENLVQKITIRPDQSYILVAHGTFDATDDVPVEISVLEGAEIDANEGEVALQFFHGGFDAPGVDLLLENILFDDVTYGNFGAAYQYLPADHYPFVLTPADDNETVLGTYGAKLRFRGGQSGLIFASGSLEEGSFGLWMALSSGRTFPLIPLSNSLENRENFIFLTEPVIQTKAVVSPNPASVNHNLQLELLEAKNVSIYLLNARGQMVETVFEGYQDAGYYNFERQLNDLPKGLYFYEIVLNGEKMVKRFVVK
ncbi:MAG: DUF4397 domain-containing protein [Bacteroidota bacterium]